MGKSMKDTLVMEAFVQGYAREVPEDGLIVHTDQGSQYTSSNFRRLLKQHKAIHSNSRKGNPYDNAMMESFLEP
jgi:putative transposase